MALNNQFFCYCKLKYRFIGNNPIMSDHNLLIDHTKYFLL
jgi:hypothetical protein